MSSLKSLHFISLNTCNLPLAFTKSEIIFIIYLDFYAFSSNSRLKFPRKKKSIVFCQYSLETNIVPCVYLALCEYLLEAGEWMNDNVTSINDHESCGAYLVPGMFSYYPISRTVETPSSTQGIRKLQHPGLAGSKQQSLDLDPVIWIETPSSMPEFKQAHLLFIISPHKEKGGDSCFTVMRT